MAQIGPTAPRRSARPSIGMAPLALAIAGVVLIAAFVWRGHPADTSVQVAVAPAPSSAPAAAPSWPDAAELTHWVVNPDQPLETEMHAVIHDARGAVTAVADNFFPEKLRHTLIAFAKN